MKRKIINNRSWSVQNITWVLLIALLFTLSLRFPGDPDLGWHLRNGAELLSKFDLFSGDIYSWTMYGYPWVPHEWLADMLMAIINNYFGLWGLVVIFTSLITYLFYFAAGIFRTDKITQAIVAIMALTVSYNVIGIRPQMITLLGVAILLYLLFKIRDQGADQLIKWLPALMLLWANLHGGFSIAFIIIITFLIAELVRIILLGKTKPNHAIGKVLSINQIKSISIFTGLGFLATMINPNGWRVYWEIYQTFSDRSILNTISEWIGVTLYHPASYNLAILALIILGLLVINKFKVDLTKLILVSIIFYFSVSAWRHVPIFAIVALPLLTEQFSYAVDEGLGVFSKIIWMPVLIFAMILSLGYNYYIGAGAGLKNDQAYANYTGYPYGAVEYMKHHYVGDKLLNEYNWGGYLIWKYPEEKVFIDGRMAIWKWKGVEIFAESKRLLGGHQQTVLDGLAKWDIDHILTTPVHPINAILKNQENWQQAYTDKTATVWVKH